MLSKYAVWIRWGKGLLDPLFADYDALDYPARTGLHRRLYGVLDFQEQSYQYLTRAIVEPFQHKGGETAKRLR